MEAVVSHYCHLLAIKSRGEGFLHVITNAFLVSSVLLNVALNVFFRTNSLCRRGTLGFVVLRFRPIF